MLNKKLSIVLSVFCAIVVSGCATTQQGASIISESFQSKIKREVFVVPVIDSRSGKDGIRDIKDMGNYNSFYENTIVSTVNDRGFVCKDLRIDVKKCRSLKTIQPGNPIECLKTYEVPANNIVLLISIDEYIPPKSMSMTAAVGVTGMLYDLASNKVLWQNSIRQETGNEVLMFGLGGYLGGLLAKSMQSPEKPYEGAAYTAIRALLKTLPNCPESIKLQSS